MAGLYSPTSEIVGKFIRRVLSAGQSPGSLCLTRGAPQVGRYFVTAGLLQVGDCLNSQVVTARVKRAGSLRRRPTRA
jgi:hypothetical protein